MKKVSRTFYYHQFSPALNKITTGEKKICSRSLTNAERKTIRLYHLFIALFITTIVFSVSVIIISVWFSQTYTPLFLTGIGLGLIAICSSAPLCAKAMQYEDKISAFNQWGFETEELLWEQHYDEQMQLMTAWRKEHPLEEAVRKAQESNNCVDIVEAARLYAEQYFKGVF